MSSFADRRVRRPLGMLLLVCMVILVAGVPLPVIRQKQTSSPFPCQDSPCGCNTAAQCWDRCCCHSDSAKLAWAEKNGVTPPAFLVERVAAHVKNSTGENSTGENSMGISIKATRAICCSAPKPAAENCCSTTPKKTQAEKQAVNNATAKDNSVRVVLLKAVNKCNGIELAIRIFSSALVGIRRPVSELSFQFFLYAMIIGNDAADSLPAAIDPPIP